MAVSPTNLYVLAEEAGIDVIWFELWSNQSMAIQLEDGTCAIAIDPWKMDSTAKENTAIGHELGHCLTGSFYSPHAMLDVREKHENRADKWAISCLVSKEELTEAVESGHTELWDLADYFNVTEDFMRKAICWYKNGNLAVDLFC